jgi:Flp pilus assembly protein TadD
MATQDAILADAAKRIIAGEEMGEVLGVTDMQLKAIAALGYNKYEQGRLEDAETMFRGVAALDTKSYFGYAGLGTIALAKRPPDLETAFTNLSKAAELKPDDATIQANLGEVLLRQGKLEQAKSHLEKAFQLDPAHKDQGVNRARAVVSGLDMVVKEAEKRQEQNQTRAKAS